MELLPDPPAAAPALPQPEQYTPAAPTPRAGELTRQWSTLFWLGWLLIAASFVAIWVSSAKIGIATWWLGPTTEPRFILINLLPLIAPLGLAIAAVMRARRLPWFGIAGAVVAAVIAAFDIADAPGYAAIEFALALAGLFISVAGFGGMYRAVTDPEATTTPTP
ncbi:MAG: hypothetical protein ABMA25_09950 [Ilumatobacteraceae bacterium]